MSVYDDEKTNEDQLRSITGIDKAEEKAMEARAAEDEEKGRLDDQVGKGFSEDNDKIGDGFKDEGGKKRRFRITKKQGIAGGIAGVLIGGGFGIMTIVQGPMQFVHIAQLLQRFHFADMEDAGDDRMTKLTRYIRHKNARYRTRMGIVGNAVADRIERKMNKTGFESAYTENNTWGDGYRIDPAKVPEDSELGRHFNRNSPTAINDVTEALTKHYGVPRENIHINIERGVVHVSSDGLGYFKSKKLVYSVLRDAGYSRIGSTMRARIMGKRAGITWHPLRRLDNKILKTVETRLAKWKEERQKRINGDVEDTGNTRYSESEESKTDTNGDGTPDSTPDIGEVADTADDITPNHTDPPDARVQSVRSKVLNRGMGVAAAVGIICAVQSIADNVDNVKHANVVMPLMRMGMEAVTVGNQVMTGQDFDMEQLGFMAKQLNDSGSWAAARSIQAELGNDLTGPDILPEAEIKTEKNAVSQFLGQFPGLGGMCKATGSIIGQVAMTAFGILTGPVSTLGGEAFTRLAGPKIVDGIIRWLAGAQIDINVAGANYGNYINYGARLAANDSAIAAGGRALTATESLALKTDRLKWEQEEIRTASFFDRIFNPYNTYSVAAKFIDQQNPNFASNLAQLTKHSLNFTSVFGSIFKSFTPRAAAAESYDYGFPQYGFSEAELSNNSTRNPYENAEKVAELFTNESKYKEYNERAEKCFGITLSKELEVTSKSEVPKYHEIPSSCSDPSEEWLRVRLAIFDTQLMESVACYEGEDTSCQSIGFGGGSQQSSAPSSSAAGQNIVGDIGESSDNISCAPGTNDLGTVTSRYTGSLKKTGGPLVIRLCQIPDIPGEGNNTEGKEISGGAIVNSRVSGAWLALAQQAKKDGINLVASSSFRLADSCGGSGDGSACAKPGTSLHQLGIAIDFKDMGTKGGSTSSCVQRATAPNNPSWVWLSQNAHKYGFKQYSYEPWHWDPANLSNRCGPIL